MGFTPPLPLLFDPNVVSLYSPECLGQELGGLATVAPASGAWQTANDALYIPFRLSQGRLFTRAALYNGASAADNVDFAIYNDVLARLVTLGSTARAGTNAFQAFDITDVYLTAGRYYVGIALDGTTGSFFAATLSIELIKMCGVGRQATAMPLPDPAVPATNAVHTRLPIFALSTRAFI